MTPLDQLDQLKQKTIDAFQKKFENESFYHLYKEPREHLEAFLTQAIEEAWEAGRAEGARDERQFVLNVLDGIDLADAQLGLSPQSRSLRFALRSRPIAAALEAEQPFPPDHAYCISRGFDVCEHTSTKKNEPA